MIGGVLIQKILSIEATSQSTQFQHMRKLKNLIKIQFSVSFDFPIQKINKKIRRKN
ncbi:hypothetical protein pb186bvf_008814 [Paramecium bursaria]